MQKPMPEVLKFSYSIYSYYIWFHETRISTLEKLSETGAAKKNINLEEREQKGTNFNCTAPATDWNWPTEERKYQVDCQDRSHNDCSIPIRCQIIKSFRDSTIERDSQRQDRTEQGRIKVGQKKIFFCLLFILVLLCITEDSHICFFRSCLFLY